MNPKLSNEVEDEDGYHFTLSGVNVSIANGLRRIILSEIPTVVFNTDNYLDENCKIMANTFRIHNEIIKQRLGCIPIHSTSLDELPGKYVMELDVSNDTDAIMFVTTEHFRIRNKNNGHYLTEEATRRIFPMNPLTQGYVILGRLRPKMADNIPGEQLKLECEFSVSTARVSSMFNVVSTCTYSNTIDTVDADRGWAEQKKKMLEGKDASMTDVLEDVEFQKKNFYLLDAQKYFIKDSFDFTIETVGVYENRDIVKKGLMVLQNKFIDLINLIDAENVTIVISENTMDNSFDIILDNEDYTMGKVIEYIMYQKYFEEEKKLNYCGFVKLHPHDNYSLIRIAFKSDIVCDKTIARQLYRVVCVEAQQLYTDLYKKF